MDQGTIEWDLDLLKKLDKAIKEAEEHGEDEFTFCTESVFVTAYARYLSQYLHSRLDHGGAR